MSSKTKGRISMGAFADIPRKQRVTENREEDMEDRDGEWTPCPLSVSSVMAATWLIMEPKAERLSRSSSRIKPQDAGSGPSRALHYELIEIIHSFGAPCHNRWCTTHCPPNLRVDHMVLQNGLIHLKSSWKEKKTWCYCLEIILYLILNQKKSISDSMPLINAHYDLQYI